MILTSIKPLLVSLLVIIGQHSNYKTEHLIHNQPLPKVIVVGQKIKQICGSKLHLGCYSAPSNLIILKHLRENNAFDLDILVHELYHHVQWHNGKKTDLEPETYKFEKNFSRKYKRKSIQIDKETIRLAIESSKPVSFK